MHIRPREKDDFGPLETIARAVHKSDGYPLYMPDDDFRGLLDSADAIAAWVAVTDDNLIGQVSLHSRSSPEVNAFIVDQLGLAEDRLGVVARLIVDPSRRRAGVARALLETAEQAAIDRGLTPILDVVDQFTPAIALYERQGWKRRGTVSIDLPDATTINEHIYTAPG
ncbi:MAG: GNAT family N-acetyltransferase [Actinomycetia bacterium]|nr:GNAT family N-acetyltransferase [Actinomycetes bacterium]